MIPFQFGFFRLLAVPVPICWFHFDGTNEYLRIPTSSSLDFEYNDPFSISIWCRFDSVLSGNKDIIGKVTGGGTRGYIIQTQSGGKIRIALISAAGVYILAATPNSTYAADIWYNIIFTYSGNNLASGCTLYVNAVDITFTSVVDTLGTNTIVTTSDLTICARSNGGNLTNGDRDEVSIWSKELSSTDATDIRNLGRSNPDLSTITDYNTNCVSHWRMGENDIFNSPNWTIVDEKGTNNGVSVNMDINNKECD